MTIKLFYKNQRDLAESINKIIDAYWNDDMKEETLINSLFQIYKYNSEKVIKDNQFTTILQQQCGKRRLILLEQVLKMKEMTVGL